MCACVVVVGGGWRKIIECRGAPRDRCGDGVCGVPRAPTAAGTCEQRCEGKV